MLPKIDVPLYELVLPLCKKKIKFRPFLVKEEKILLMAIESDDKASMLLAIKQIIVNCCVGDIDVNTLPMTDIEFLFLNLRARSIGEVVELQYKCNNLVKNTETEEEVRCGNLIKYSINILDIKPSVPKDHSNIIKLDERIGVALKYPSFEVYNETQEDGMEIENTISYIINSIDYIFDNETMYYAKDTPKEELIEFVENLSHDQYKEVKSFFDNIPKIKTTIDFQCPKCKYKETIVVEGVQNFLS